MKTSIFAVTVGLGFLFASSYASADIIELRPNDPVYVKLGKNIYMEQCASCHGVNLEGQEGWRDKMVDGMRLAPPHDRSGHTRLNVRVHLASGDDARVRRPHPDRIPSDISIRD